MDENLKQLQKILGAFNQDVLTRKEFTQVTRKIVNLMAELKRKYEEIATKLDRDHSSAFTRLKEDSARSHSELKGRVDSLFIGERFKKMQDEHSGKMKVYDEKIEALDGIIKMANEKLLTIKSGRPGKNADPILVSDMVYARIGEELADVKKIRGIKKRIGKVEKRLNVVGGVSGRDLFKEKDISSSLDGSTKTFSIGAFHTIISISLSSYPYGALRKGVDFTQDPVAGKITFTNLIDATTQLSAGQQCVITLILS